MYRLDPEAHLDDSPTAVELAALSGCVKTFALLTARLQIDSNSEWFQLAQVCIVTLLAPKGALVVTVVYPAGARSAPAGPKG